MNKYEAASDIGESLNDSYRTYSGTRKWWRGYHAGLEWKISFREFEIQVRAQLRNKPMGGHVVRFLEKDFPVFETGEETVTYENGDQFLSDASAIAKSKMEEQAFREAVRREISSLLF